MRLTPRHHRKQEAENTTSLAEHIARRQENKINMMGWLKASVPPGAKKKKKGTHTKRHKTPTNPRTPPRTHTNTEIHTQTRKHIPQTDTQTNHLENRHENTHDTKTNAKTPTPTASTHTNAPPPVYHVMRPRTPSLRSPS